MDQDDNQKSRGLKHRTSKKKYNKGRASHVPAKTKSAVALDSNWDRYEQEQVENKVSSSTDFAILANAPITRGSHFQFKSDKDDVREIVEPVNPSMLFDLDLTLLDKSLSTIPFHVRSSIENNYFTESQHRLMTTLEDNINDYSSYLSSYHKIKDADPVFGSEGESSDGASDPDDKTSKQWSPEPSGSEPPPKPTESSGDDLEQWLDDILDD